jgi:putative PIN family toxin of toxin-antitoxin system
VKVFLDTNVLVSAFATRGLCADVVRVVLAEHEMLVGEVVIRELRSVFGKKIRVPKEIVAEIENLLRDQTVIPKPKTGASVALRDPDDAWVLASAVARKTDVLVTGDRDLLALGKNAPIPILDPRGFWSLIAGSRSR